MQLFCYGANDENGKLIELKIPAETIAESKNRLSMLVGEKDREFWLNDVKKYDYHRNPPQPGYTGIDY
ncbi:hypothetical protein [uncultured Robinsoniella sp.]|uniref:hypothetical protein n=1 Tax=uncultured Robinsoniella sp. TaxID=904190 RepID=UPI00290B7851|nr:hypothetical protein [Clostridiales bacterium]